MLCTAHFVRNRLERFELPSDVYEYCASTVRCRRQEFTFARHIVVLSNAENTATVSELCYLVIFSVTLKRKVQAILYLLCV